MNYSTVYVGMDVHKDSFAVCCYTNEKEKPEYIQTLDAHYSKVLNYIEAMRFHYGDDAMFICGYEAGCLGYTLYHQLTNHGVKCVILAPSTMSKPAGGIKVKTDKRDAALIARCLAHRDYKPVHIPTAQDEQVKEYIRMRDDHNAALKKVKQQILSFCLRHDHRFDGGKSNWTQKHLAWLKALDPEGLYKEILEEYLITYEMLKNKIERIDRRIEELASDRNYEEKVKKLNCFLGIKTYTALSLLVETGDFNRFDNARSYSAYLGLVPGEDSSGSRRTGLSITKAGNSHLRRLLIEATQAYSRGQIGHKSKILKEKQEGNTPTTIAYADKANERLRRKYYGMTLRNGKNANIAKTAVARELSCFIWGMMTENYAQLS